MVEQWDLWTSLAEGTPASHSVSPGSDEARMMTATSGRHLLGLYQNSGRLGSLARMLLGTSRWASTQCFLTWKDLATPGKRLLFRLSPWTQSTDATEYGLLPTPVASDTGGYNQSASEGAAIRPGLEMMAKRNLWPTPSVCGNHNRKGASETSGDGLATVVKMFPTPVARDYRDSGSPAEANRHTPSLAYQVGGSLNPEFVEWLMGYPIGHTDLEHSETPSSLK